MTQGQRPTHKISIVRDGKPGPDGKKNDKDARWARLGSLWPTANGGLSGPVQLAAPLLLPSDNVRIVVTPLERDEPEGEPQGATVDGPDVPY